MLEFLAALFDGYPGQNYAELRTIGRTVLQRFYAWPGEAGDLMRHAAESDAAGIDVYTGVLPRTRPGGTAADCPFMVRTLWADVDAKNVGGRNVAIQSAMDFDLRPSMLVDSGHGCHAYYLLRDPIEYTDARAAMKGLARELGGDNVSDAPRVLRCPGTTNWKDPDKPVPVRLLYLDLTRRYRWWDFSALAEQPRHLALAEMKAGAVGSTPPGDEIKEMPDWLADLVLTGAPRGKRSEACFKAVMWLLRYGYTESAIQDVMDVYPIGEKYREKGRAGKAWLGYTIRAAREANS